MPTKRWKKGYKVVHKIDGHWCSLINICGDADEYTAKYQLNVVTKRPFVKKGTKTYVGGPLCVFSNFEDADDFYFYDDQCGAIFECKYKESEDTKIWRLKYKRYARKCYVEGKVLADEVILTKRLNKREMRRHLKEKRKV